MSTTAHSLHQELPHADDELMTIKEVARLVRVPEATLRYRRHLGTGPHSFRGWPIRPLLAKRRCALA